MNNCRTIVYYLSVLGALLALVMSTTAVAQDSSARFHLEEATITDIQQALLSGELTTVRLVELYLERIKAYNGTCVDQLAGILGPVTTIPDAGQINALATLNLRPATREAWGFDARKARSLTDAADDDSDMPDALETAALQDRRLRRTGELVGPLHGVIMASKTSTTHSICARLPAARRRIRTIARLTTPLSSAGCALPAQSF